MNAGFDQEIIRFEKALTDRAQTIIKSLQVKHLDRLINIVSHLRKILNGLNADENVMEVANNNFKFRVANDIQNLIALVEG